MNPILAENQFGHGGLGHFIKPTDWQYHNIAPKGSEAFDWSKGYDVEHELAILLNTPNFRIPVENQFVSGSCGGQAGRYYDSVLQAIRTGVFIRKSAKYVYAPIAQPGGGSFGGDIMARLKKNGDSSEIICPSYLPDGNVTEAFMEKVSDITPQADIDASSGKTANYSFILDFDINTLAQATRDNHGIIVALFGQNNGTWLTAFPNSPTAIIGSTLLWGHWLYVGKALMINGKKYIAILNSWGDKIGLFGWQFISEDYVNAGFVQLGMQMAFGTPNNTFNKDLFLGMTDADIYFLQKRLNQDPATMIAPSGMGSPGNETYYFGALTQAAVIKFQQKNGIMPAIGYCGIKTRTLLNQ